MPRKILIVDDSAINREILKNMLGDEYTVLEADNGRDALDVMEREYQLLSVILLDLGMPVMDGYEVLEHMRGDDRLSLLPVIVATGQTDDDSEERALSLGAKDYISKPYKSAIIKQRVKNTISLRETAATVNALRRDRLTGLYGRDAFFERVRELVSEHGPGYYVIASADIDSFKVINDQYGTQKGDEVLRHAASAFNSGFDKNGGVCCRLSADNFAVLYPAALMDSTELERIRADASRIEGLVSPITFSIGRYVIDDVTLPPSAMYDRAVLAAGTIKGRYDGHVALYDETLRAHLLLEQEIVNEMDDALREGQFEVWFQPQYNNTTDSMIGAEALVRWRHPQKGLVPPGAFIPIFEKSGFIYSLDKFVWEETCRYLRKWLDEGRSPLPVSVNMSRYDMFRPDVVDVITRLVNDYSLPMDLLRLEITESAFSESTDHIVNVVKALVERGFTVEIDDFGTGYSSLNTLKDVPAQIIKLDMKFLESSHDSGRGGNIVESVVRMAKWLGMSVIAEGVETREQADYMRSIGCSYMQGYLYARPMTAEKYEEHCRGEGKEERLLALETVDNLDNSAFWDPKSMDTLIFNSYVGAACIFEYHNGSIELLRITEKYARMLGISGMPAEQALKLDFAAHLDERQAQLVRAAIEESAADKTEFTGEYVFLDLPDCPHETYLRSSMRVIASAGNRYLVYCITENITAQRQSEKREREVTEQLTAVMENINAGVTATVLEDGKFNIIFANSRHYANLGYTKAEYTAQYGGIPNTILPEDRDMVSARCRAVNESGQPESIEFRIRRADGAVRWIRSNITVIKYPGVDSPVQLAVGIDITEQREAERTIRLLSEQMQAIMGDVNSGITAAVLDEEGHIELLFANERFYTLHGYTREQYETEIDEDKFDCVHPDDREKALDDTVAAYTSRTPAKLHYRLIQRDGSIRWVKVELSSTRFTGIDQNVHLCIFTDITAEKQAEQKVMEASAQLRTMMDDMPGGFVRVQAFPDGRIKPVYFNAGFMKLVGMGGDELLALYGDDVLGCIHPDDVEKVKTIAVNVTKSGEAQSSFYRLRCKNGGYIWVSTFERATVDEAGNVFISIYYNDATGKIEKQEVQRALLDNLPGGAGLYEFDGRNLSAIYLNKTYWQLVGREATDYSGILPMDAIHPDDSAVVAAELASAISQKRDLVCDMRLRHESGKYRAVHIVGHIVPEDGADGKYLIYAAFTPTDGQPVSYQHMLPLLLSAVMDSTTDMTFAKDKNFRYLSASKAFARMAGCEEAGEVIGKTDYDLFDKSLADRFRSDDTAIFQSGKALVDIVEPMPSQDGAPRYSSMSKYILRDGSGEVVGLYGIGRDVTKAVFQDSQLGLVNDSIPGGLATYVCTMGDFSPEHIKISYFNDGFCKLFGFTREEYLNRDETDAASMVFEEDHGLLVKQWLALMERNTPIDCLYRARVNGGGYKWISHRAVAADRRNGVVVINAILQDVTDQRELIERLRISEEENNLAVQLGGNIICRYFIADRSMVMPKEVAALNSLPVRVTDVPYLQVRQGFVAPDSVDTYVSFFESILRGEKTAEATFCQRYCGSWRWMEAKSATVFSDIGEPVKAVISFNDVTEKLERESIYKKWQQSITGRPAETYTLYRCNLNNDASYTIAEGKLFTFDFESAGQSFNERARAYVKQCVYSEDRDAYIAFANSDTMLASYYRGKRQDALEFRELVPGAEPRWLRLTVELVEQPNSGDVDAYLLYEDIDDAKQEELQTRQRAQTDPLTGLLNRATFAEKFENAISSAQPGAITALFILDLDGFKHVNDTFGHASGDETLIEMGQKLRDTFRGQDLVCRLGGDEFMVCMSGVTHISAVSDKASLICALLHKSFSVEVQLSASVGIAVCPDDGDDFETLYHKADIALYCVKGAGKDNYAFYEESMGEMKPASIPTPEDSAHMEALYTTPRRRMLIVEDNEINRDYLSSLFDEEYIIDTASEGTAALVMLRRYGSAISVVLLDLMMPGLDGFAVLRQMRENIAMQTIPVIVVSGMDERETCLEAIKNGASDFITKPVDADLLRLRVASAISKAENEQLRAQNRYLAIQNEEAKRLAEARRHSEELSVALHAAERADLAKSQFLSSMSHEIRTPLNAVIGYNSIARSEMTEAKTDEERRQANMKVMDCLTKSEVASRHLLTIINDVLDMSAIESGKMKVEDSPFDFKSLITSLTVMFFSQARAKGVTFEVRFEKPTDEWFVGDQMRINQVLTNLLSNAVKFTQEGGSVTLIITETVIDENAAGFRFVVTDTGIGMTQEYIEHIWTPFEQAEASISRRFGGTGLGLSITKNLVELMGGSIEVESTSGVGSTFTVELTLTRTLQPKKPTNYDFSNINALVVDDDVSTCDYIKLLFDRCGASCMALTSGQQAVEAYAASKESGKPFNICLVDWRMPHMDGFATISAIRRTASKDVPIVVVTAYDFTEVADQAEKLGINRFISKPLFQSSLFDLLATVTGKQSQSEMAKAPKYDFEGARVLLVEDNNMNMEVARHILAASNMAVDCAWNGQEAVDIFTASRPGTYRAILMDVHMPEMDGYQATRIIRAAEREDAKTVPIIAMTADVFAEDIAEAHNAGMNDHIAKPIDIESLFKLLSTYLEEDGE